MAGQVDPGINGKKCPLNGSTMACGIFRFQWGLSSLHSTCQGTTCPEFSTPKQRANRSITNAIARGRAIFVHLFRNQRANLFGVVIFLVGQGPLNYFQKVRQFCSYPNKDCSENDFGAFSEDD